MPILSFDTEVTSMALVNTKENWKIRDVFKFWKKTKFGQLKNCVQEIKKQNPNNLISPRQTIKSTKNTAKGGKTDHSPVGR